MSFDDRWRFIWAQTGAVERTSTNRRALVLGGAGALLAVATGRLLKQLADLGTFAYDGLEYRGAELQPITPNDRFYTVTKNIVDQPRSDDCRLAPRDLQLSRFLGYAPDVDGRLFAYTVRAVEPNTASLLVNNRAVPLGIQDIQGYDATHLRRYDEYLAMLNGQPPSLDLVQRQLRR